ncbi:hypothetical protein QJS66_05875 [Kocuria rhizophila]|nr:hypothetical protein QJS66_05875 [Kocuria rhizophila]
MSSEFITTSCQPPRAAGAGRVPPRGQVPRDAGARAVGRMARTSRRTRSPWNRSSPGWESGRRGSRTFPRARPRGSRSYKPNERISRRSPLSDVEELEALRGRRHAKRLGGEVLLEAPDDRLTVICCGGCAARRGAGEDAGPVAAGAGPQAHQLVTSRRAPFEGTP